MTRFPPPYFSASSETSLWHAILHQTCQSLLPDDWIIGLRRSTLVFVQKIPIQDRRRHLSYSQSATQYSSAHSVQEKEGKTLDAGNLLVKNRQIIYKKKHKSQSCHREQKNMMTTVSYALTYSFSHAFTKYTKTFIIKEPRIVYAFFFSTVFLRFFSENVFLQN